MAARHGKIHVVKILIVEGANQRHLDNDKQTALALAQDYEPTFPRNIE